MTPPATSLTAPDFVGLRAAIAAAGRALAHGNQAHGAALVDSIGNVLLEGENDQVTTRDCTGHAETNLVRVASRQYSPEFLAQCTLYASTEPCVMCAAAVCWSGIGRVVYALGSSRLRLHLIGQAIHPPLDCRTVIQKLRPHIPVIGPVPELDDEALRNFPLP